MDYFNKDLVIKDVKLKCQIWDTAGQEKYRHVVKQQFKGVKGVLIVFDILDQKTF